MRSITVIVFLALGVNAAQAAERNRDLERAKKLLDAFKDRAALRALSRAARRPNDDQTRAEIELYRGIAYFNLLARSRARRAFRKALRIDRDVVLPSNVSPKIRRLFAAERRRLPPVAPPAVEPKATAPPAPKAPTGEGSAGIFNTPSKPPPRAKPATTVRPPTETVVDYPVEEDEEEGSGIRWIWPAWISAGVAVAAAGAGLGLGLAAKSSAEDAADLERLYSDAEDLHSTAEGQALGANISFAVAGAAAAAAVVFFVLDWTSDDVVASVTPSGSGFFVGIGGLRW